MNHEDLPPAPSARQRAISHWLPGMGKPEKIAVVLHEMERRVRGILSLARFQTTVNPIFVDCISFFGGASLKDIQLQCLAEDILASEDLLAFFIEIELYVEKEMHIPEGQSVRKAAARYKQEKTDRGDITAEEIIAYDLAVKNIRNMLIVIREKGQAHCLTIQSALLILKNKGSIDALARSVTLDENARAVYKAIEVILGNLREIHVDTELPQLEELLHEVEEGII